MDTYASQDVIKDIVKNSKNIAVVGLSDKPDRASYSVASYLKSKGYTIIPVNPTKTEILDEKCYPDLKSIAGDIDVVNVFRRSDAVMPIVEEAIEVGAKAVWMQEGVVNEQAARKAEEAGLKVVMDRCLLKEHVRLK